jgi:hypothetical protein
MVSGRNFSSYIWVNMVCSFVRQHERNDCETKGSAEEDFVWQRNLKFFKTGKTNILHLK